MDEQNALKLLVFGMVLLVVLPAVWFVLQTLGTLTEVLAR